MMNSVYEKAILEAARFVSDRFRAQRLRASRILVVGASGLIGRVLCDLLMRLSETGRGGVSLCAVSRNAGTLKVAFGSHVGKPGFSLLAHDVNEPFPELGNFDYIVHAASNTHPVAYSTDPVGTITANVIGTRNLLEYARLHAARRFAFLSSVEIYGESFPRTERFSEKDMGYIDCNTVRAGYPESKRVGESLCCAYAEQHGLDVVIPRLCRVYGPTMKPDDSKALSQFIKKAVAGEDIVLKSDGSQFYSYVHAIDAATAILKVLLDGSKGEAYNVSSEDSDVTLRTLAQKLADMSGGRVVFDVPDEAERKGYSAATRAVLDSGKLIALGWKALYNIDSGLRMTVDVLKGKESDGGA